MLTFDLVEIGVIGYGYWGPNLVRNFMETADCRVTVVWDRNEERLALAKRRYNHPVTCTEATDLIEEADRRSLTLMVDHPFAHTGTARRIREIVCSGAFGKPYYYDSVRVNLGIFQQDVNVIWNLAVHDLCILHHLTTQPPNAVSATGICHFGSGAENVAYLTLFYPGNFIAHVAVNWLAPVKVRQVLIGGSNQMIVYNDLEPSEKVKVYDKGVTVSSAPTPEDLSCQQVGYRTVDMWAPEIGNTEALRTEMAHFLECVRTGLKTITNGGAGLHIVRILETATRSLCEQGRPLELDLRPVG